MRDFTKLKTKPPRRTSEFYSLKPWSTFYCCFCERYFNSFSWNVTKVCKYCGNEAWDIGLHAFARHIHND